jgi:hypothetical protein
MEAKRHFHGAAIIRKKDNDVHWLGGWWTSETVWTMWRRKEK